MESIIAFIKALRKKRPLQRRPAFKAGVGLGFFGNRTALKKPFSLIMNDVLNTFGKQVENNDKGYIFTYDATLIP